ncbi:MAG: polysaccharide deacetylase family protein [Pseudomonadota bacterium]
MMSKVTLTFDNGPTVETTPQVLGELRRRDLQAYFCLVAEQLLKGQEQVDIANQAQAEGHILVNHSLTHGVALGDDPSVAHAEREVWQAHGVLSDKLTNWQPRWFRPFGRGGKMGQHLLSQASLSHFHELGYSVLLWNSVPRDWENIDGWVTTALAQLSQHEHTVVVLHDLNTGAMEHLGRFLDQLLIEHETTLALPRDCVPIEDGQIAWPDSQFQRIITKN